MPGRFRGKLSEGKGMTLVEILIAVSIISFLGLVLYTIFYQGTKLWRRAALMQIDIDSDMVFEKMSSDLRNAYSGSPGQFTGKGGRVEFFSYSKNDLRDGSGSFTVKNPVRVRYAYQDDSHTLLRLEQDYRTLLSAKLEKQDAPGTPVAEKVKECRFEYLHENPEKKTFQWKDFWNDACPPKAVRVSLQFDDQKSAAIARKIIALPAGGCAAPVPAAGN